MTDDRNSRLYAVVAGEPSGDVLAAGVVRAMAQRAPGARFVGIGGDALAREGVDLVAHTGRMASMGVVDVAANLARWLDAWAELRLACRAQPPAAALLVDSPEVNLRLARAFQRDGVKVLQYVPPKVWAWRRGRLQSLRRCTDHVALVLPFEESLYREAGVPATYVGHPLAEAHPPETNVRERLHVGKGMKVVALLPGSRRAEVRRMGPVMVELGARLLKKGVRPVFAPGHGADDSGMRQLAVSMGCTVWDGSARELLSGTDAAVAASGTVTLEAALEQVPMAIVYRTDPVSWALARRLVKVPYVGLPNWVAGREIVPEFLQDDVRVGALEEVVLQLLAPEESRRQRRELARVGTLLGRGGTAATVAELLHSMG